MDWSFVSIALLLVMKSFGMKPGKKIKYLKFSDSKEKVHSEKLVFYTHFPGSSPNLLGLSVEKLSSY